MEVPHDYSQLLELSLIVNWHYSELVVVHKLSVLAHHPLDRFLFLWLNVPRLPCTKITLHVPHWLGVLFQHRYLSSLEFVSYVWESQNVIITVIIKKEIGDYVLSLVLRIIHETFLPFCGTCSFELLLCLKQKFVLTVLAAYFFDTPDKLLFFLISLGLNLWLWLSSLWLKLEVLGLPFAIEASDTFLHELLGKLRDLDGAFNWFIYFRFALLFLGHWFLDGYLQLVELLGNFGILRCHHLQMSQ